MSRNYYEPEDEDADDLGVPIEEAQPDHFCDCRPTLELRHPWQHHPDCHRHAPPLTGPGSTPEGRAQARRLYEAARTAREGR